ncbi:MAG: hypothetical protein WDA08_00415 [Weeksellaceae bacterium]
MSVLLSINSCIEEDFKLTNSTNEDVSISNRADKFFLFNEQNQLSKTQSFVNLEFVEKLERINNEKDFISDLSDLKGIPQWSYARLSGSNLHSRGSDEETDFVVIPLRVEGENNLSSLLYIKNPDSENPINLYYNK